MTDAFIVLFGALALVCAVLVITLHHPMRAALALIAHMICIAAIFATLSVHVVALFQVLIYVGAVMVFMVYTIMLLDDRDVAYRQPYSTRLLPALAVAAMVAVTLLALVLQPSAIPGVPAPPAPSFEFRAFSIAFMKQYWFHFEVATVLLLVGILAAWTAIRESR